MDAIKLGIEREGQKYLDTPVIAQPRADLLTPIAMSIAGMFGRVREWRDARGIPHRELADAPPITVGYERTRLRWRKP